MNIIKIIKKQKINNISLIKFLNSKIEIKVFNEGIGVALIIFL